MIFLMGKGQERSEGNKALFTDHEQALFHIEVEILEEGSAVRGLSSESMSAGTMYQLSIPKLKVQVL